MRAASTSRRGSRAGYADVAFYCPQAADLLDPSTEILPGGAEHQIVMLSRQLAARGHDVVLIVRGERSRLPKEVEGVRIAVQGHNRLRAPVVSDVETMLRTALAIWTSPAANYVQRGAGGISAVVRVSAWLRRARFIYSSASLVDFDYGRLETAKHQVVLSRFAIRRADAVVAQTDEQRDLCAARLGRDAQVIRSICEPQPQRSSEPEMFLWAGRPAFYKRPLEFVELARAVPEARFCMVLVTSEIQEPGSEAVIAAAEKALDNLELLDPLPREQLGELIERSVAVVNTSEYEGLSNVFLEAWARGVPGLTLSHDPDRLLEAEGLGYFAGGSFERLCQQARQMWQSRLDQVEVAARCRAYVGREHAVTEIGDQWCQTLGL